MNLMQRVAALFGVAFVAVGLLGFTVTGVTMPTMHGLHETMEGAPRLLGLFPVNVTHNLVHVALGVWGLLAARGERGALTYALASGVLYATLAGVGAFWPTVAGIVPIGGYDVGLHLAIGVALIGCAVYAMTTESDAPVPAASTAASGDARR
jgi:hypothetical protein